MRTVWKILPLLLAVLLTQQAAAQAPLQAPPGLGNSGKRGFADYLLSDYHRAFAQSPSGSWGYAAARRTPAEAAERAVEICQRRGATCKVVTINDRAVADGAIPDASAWPPPAANVGELRAPAGFIWHGAAKARGAIVWSHGVAPGWAASWATSVPRYVRRFNAAGWDVWRFDRDPRYDTIDWATGKLLEGVTGLRQAGYGRIIASGQSRGAWHSINALRTASAIDAVIATAPAAHGTSEGSVKVLRGFDDFRLMLGRIENRKARVAIFTFDKDDYDPDPAARGALARAEFDRFGNATFIAARPAGLEGHSIGSSSEFDAKFGACLLRFVDSSAPGPFACR